jgi:hypothetical protein
VENIKILSKNIRNNSHQNIILLKLKLTVRTTNFINFIRLSYFTVNLMKLR